MREQGIDVVDLAAGEPDGPTPEAVCEAGTRAIREGRTKYTATAGIPELRERISRKLWEENGVRVPPEGVVVGCGAKHCLYGALMTLLEPGDEALLLAPFWMTYEEQVRLAGATPIVVQSSPESGFVPDPDSIRSSITQRTKAIVINTPCNPSGAVFDRKSLKEIAALALRHGLWIVSDEIYEMLVYEGRHESPAALSEEVAAQTVLVNGCSKSFSMTGWRVGYAGAPVQVAKAIANLQDQITSNASTISQYAALQALDTPANEIEAWRLEFLARRDLMLTLIREIPGLRAQTPNGAFYVLADVRNRLGESFASDAELATYLLEEAHVATIPGSVFHGPGHLRLSYATSRKQIEAGVARLASALSKLDR